MPSDKQLIFVYRAERGFFNAINHMMHRCLLAMQFNGLKGIISGPVRLRKRHA
jgi:hypothetical protein